MFIEVKFIWGLESVLKANQCSGFMVSGGAKPSSKDLSGDVTGNQSASDVTDPTNHKVRSSF